METKRLYTVKYQDRLEYLYLNKTDKIVIIEKEIAKVFNLDLSSFCLTVENTQTRSSEYILKTEDTLENISTNLITVYPITYHSSPVKK